jgi:uncharacterized protein YyaL (SSP411 family)
MLLALDFFRNRPKEIVIAVPHSRGEAEPFLSRLRTRYLPRSVLCVVSPQDDPTELARLAPITEGKVARGGQATAYLCEGGACQLPTTDPEAFGKKLAALSGTP